MYDIAILCGGLATRLGRLTEDSPKSMVDINRKPFIYHQLKLLEFNGFKNVVLCLGYLGSAIKHYVESLDLEMKISYVQEDYQLGTGGAIKNALPYLSPTFITLYGDSYLPTRFSNIISFYEGQDKPSLMTIYRNENKVHQNNVYIDRNKITYTKENPNSLSQYIDYGIGIFKKTMFENFGIAKFDLSLMYSYLIKRNELCTFEIKEKFYEVGSIEGIEELREYLKED